MSFNDHSTPSDPQKRASYTPGAPDPSRAYSTYMTNHDTEPLPAPQSQLNGSDMGAPMNDMAHSRPLDLCTREQLERNRAHTAESSDCYTTDEEYGRTSVTGSGRTSLSSSFVRESSLSSPEQTEPETEDESSVSCMVDFRPPEIKNRGKLLGAVPGGVAIQSGGSAGTERVAITVTDSNGTFTTTNGQHVNVNETGTGHSVWKNRIIINGDGATAGDVHIVNGKDAETEPRLVPRRPLSVSHQLIGTCVVGLRNELLLNVTYANIPRTIVRTKLLTVTAHCGPNKDRVICQLKPSRKGTRVYFWPRHIETCHFTVQSDGAEDFTFQLDVEGNNPVMSFSEDCDWPVAIAVRQDDHSIYVAYMRHVSKYNSAGDFERVIVRENNAHFNDLAIDQFRHRVAVSVSGWRKDGTHKFRYQAVRVYSLTGTKLWSVGKQHPLFGVSIIRIAFDPLSGNLLVASKDALCTCARSTGVVERRTEAKFGTAARMAVTHEGLIVIADGNRGHIYVFDENVKPKSDFPVRLDQMEGWNSTIDFGTSPIDPSSSSTAPSDTELPPQAGPSSSSTIVPGSPTMTNKANDRAVVGLTGLSVDRFGHVIVSECLTSSIQVYMLDGTLLVVIDSEWDICKWPLAVAVSRDGHVFVADHGNACVKKYRYM